MHLSGTVPSVLQTDTLVCRGPQSLLELVHNFYGGPVPSTVELQQSLSAFSAPTGPLLKVMSTAHCYAWLNLFRELSTCSDFGDDGGQAAEWDAAEVSVLNMRQELPLALADAPILKPFSRAAEVAHSVIEGQL